MRRSAIPRNAAAITAPACSYPACGEMTAKRAARATGDREKKIVDLGGKRIPTRRVEETVNERGADSPP